MHVIKPSFLEYEAAVESFLRNGGHTPTIILSPPGLLKQYRSHFGDLPYAGSMQIQEAEQNFVSVRGTTIGGHDYEWPPELE